MVNSDCKAKADVYCEDGIIKYVPLRIKTNKVAFIALYVLGQANMIPHLF